MQPTTLPRRADAALRAFLILTFGLPLLFTACGGGGGGAPVQPPPASYDLVYDHEAANGTRSVWRLRLDGSPSEPVPGGENAMRPHPRADGRSLVFSSQPPTAQDVSQLLLLENLTPPARRLSLDANVLEREIVYAPDGQRVAFVSRRDEPEGADVFTADLVDGELRNVRNLTPGATSGASFDVTPAWSPDGGRIAFTSYRSGGVATLWTMRADGGDVQQITVLPATGDVGDFFPVWSPDGSLLAFQRRNREQVRIGLVPATGGQPALFEFAGKAFTPAWSPDGRLLAFAGEVDGELDLYLRSADGGDTPLRFPHPGPDRNPAWIRR